MELLIFYGEDVLILSTGRKPDPSTTLRDPAGTKDQGSCGDERPVSLRGRKTSEPTGTQDQGSYGDAGPGIL